MSLGGNKIQKYYRLNQYIIAPSLRVLDEKGKQIGLFTKDEALRKAREMELDLVEIASNAKPPVAKIIDFKKLKYLEAKKNQQIKKKSKEFEIKEIHLSLFIGQHDIDTRKNQAVDFLKQGHRLKIVVKFRGREFTKKEFGFKIINDFSQAVMPYAQPQGQPKWEGKFLVLFLNPIKGEHAQSQNEKSRQ